MPSACTPQPLDLPADADPLLGSTVSGGDPTGRYVLGQTFNTAGMTTLVWQDGRRRSVDLPGREQHLTDVNSAGTIVASSSVDGVRTLWVVEGGVPRMIGSSDTSAQVWAINEHGAIAGAIADRPMLWPTTTAQPVALPMPDTGDTGQAVGVDDDGTVIGTLQHGGHAAGYAWGPDRRPTKLPAPTISGAPATDYGADAIRNGWVTGWAGQNERAAVLWNLRTGTVETRPGVLVAALNAQGWTVEQTVTAAFVDAGGRRLDLPPPPGEVKGQWPIIPRVLSDDGRTVAGHVFMGPNRVRTAVVWTCR